MIEPSFLLSVTVFQALEGVVQAEQIPVATELRDRAERGGGWEEQTATLNKAFTRHPSLCLPRPRKNLLTTSPVPPAALADPLRQDSVSTGARD